MICSTESMYFQMFFLNSCFVYCIHLFLLLDFTMEIQLKVLCGFVLGDWENKLSTETQNAG